MKVLIGQRIIEIRGKRERDEFADFLGVHSGTLGRYERGERLPDPEFLIAITWKCNISADWLLYGVPPKSFEEAANVDIRRMALLQHHSGGLAEQLLAKYHATESFMLVPLYDIRAAAGHGALVEERDASDYWAFSLVWLAQETRVSPKRLALVTVAGNSMEPDLHDGDVVMIDRGDVELLREGVYVFHLDGHVYVKHLALRGDRLVIVSRNGADYPQQEIKLLQENVTFKLIGRVIGQPLFKRM